MDFKKRGPRREITSFTMDTNVSEAKLARNEEWGQIQRYLVSNNPRFLGKNQPKLPAGNSFDLSNRAW